MLRWTTAHLEFFNRKLQTFTNEWILPEFKLFERPLLSNAETRWKPCSAQLYVHWLARFRFISQGLTEKYLAKVPAISQNIQHSETCNSAQNHLMKFAFASAGKPFRHNFDSRMAHVQARSRLRYQHTLWNPLKRHIEETFTAWYRGKYRSWNVVKI